MKTILIATDFSEAAKNATAYGMQLAKQLNADVVLFSAYHDIPFAVTSGPVVVSPKDMQRLISKKLAAEASIIDPSGAIKTACAEGNATDAIMKAARRHKASLVICGIKGTGKPVRRWLGSTVLQLSVKTQTPVLLIPEGAVYSPISVAAIANDRDIAPETAPKMFGIFFDLVSEFNSKLYFVRVIRKKSVAGFAALNAPWRLMQVMQAYHPYYRCTTGPDIAASLNRFINTNKIDMLAMISRKHNLFYRLFHRKATRLVSFSTTIPLLIIPETGRESSTMPYRVQSRGKVVEQDQVSA